MPSWWCAAALMLSVAVGCFEPGAEPEPRDWPGSCLESQEDGSTVAEIPYASDLWLARKVVSYLGRAHVLSPPSLQETVARMANALLERV